MKQAAIHSKSTLVILATLFALIWFSTLDYRKLIKPDEGRYAEIAREMALSGDWVTPRLNGIKYFEKPPLQYWATAAAFRIFGANEWTARLWSALTGFAGVLLAAFTATRLFGAAAGVFAGLVLGSSLWWVLMGHLNTLDMAFAFFLQLSLSGFLLACSAPVASHKEKNWMLVAWAAAALAVLSKGLAGLVIPGLVLFIYCLVQREWRVLNRLHWVGGILLFLVITAPWFIAVQMANPEFARFFFLHEHFARFLTTTHSRTQPVWYFVPILLAALLPWSGMAIHAAIKSWNEAPTETFNARRFLVLWSLLVFLFFSASGSKLPSYILPVLPAIALLTGDWLTRANRPALLWHGATIVALALIALVLLPLLGNKEASQSPGENHAQYANWLLVAAAVFFLGSLAALWLNGKRRHFAACASLFIAALFAWEIGLQGHQTLGRANSAYYIAEEIKPMLRPGVAFYSVGTYEQTLPYYLNRTVTLVDYRDEFGFGLDQEPQLGIADIETFKKRWSDDKEAFAMLSNDGFKILQRSGFPMREVARDPRRVIVQKP
ncbi:MAG: glycosyltransferase family 39 protein [Burkholderiales bacterium]